MTDCFLLKFHTGAVRGEGTEVLGVGRGDGFGTGLGEHFKIKQFAVLLFPSISNSTTTRTTSTTSTT